MGVIFVMFFSLRPNLFPPTHFVKLGNRKSRGLNLENIANVEATHYLHNKILLYQLRTCTLAENPFLLGSIR